MQANLATKAGQVAHYAQIRARLYGQPKPQVRVANTNQPVRLVAPPSRDKVSAPQPRPVVKVIVPPRQADAHVRAFRAWEKMQAETVSVKAFIRYGCVAYGVPYDMLMSQSKARRVFGVRRTLICMVKERWDLSTPLIGRYFKRDHSTIISALGRKGRGKGSSLTPDDVREIRRRRARREMAVTIAKDYGISPATVSDIARRETWKDVE